MNSVSDKPFTSTAFMTVACQFVDNSQHLNFKVID